MHCTLPNITVVTNREPTKKRKKRLLFADAGRILETAVPPKSFRRSPGVPHTAARMICRLMLAMLAILTACDTSEAASFAFRPSVRGVEAIAVSTISTFRDTPAASDHSGSMAARVFWRVITPGEYRRVSAAANARARTAAHANEIRPTLCKRPAGCAVESLAIAAAQAAESAQRP